MIVLGRNSDDTGTQLERLTRSILENRGYSNLAVNVATSGGQEIDVTAEYTVPVPGAAQSHRLIAECKAYRNPVAMTDWLKFLGKVFVEETRLSQDVTGLFVALSGINGNVQGNFDEIQQHRNNISLLSGASFLAELQELYHLAARSHVIERLRSLTMRQHLLVEAAYYDGAVFWIFTFPSSQYAILTASGEFPSPQQVATLTPLVEARLDATEYLDLSIEGEAQTEVNQIKKAIVAILASSGGSSTRDGLNGVQCSDSSLLARAIQEVAEEEWIASTATEVAFAHSNPDHSDHYAQLSIILRFVFDGPLSSETMRKFFTSDYLQARLNEHYLSHVSSVQGDLPLTDELGDTILKIVRVSPSACLQAITPEPLIVTHRTKQGTAYDSDEDDRRMLRRQLLTCLARDFEQPALKAFFYEDCNLREIETRQEIVVKSQTCAEIKQAVQMRRGIGRAAEKLGGGYIQILILDNAPQPWESGNVGFAG